MNRIQTSAILLLIGIVGCSPTVNSQSTKTPTQSDSPEPPAPRVAEVGVGKQGQSLNNETGVSLIIAQPAITLFRTKQKIVFEIQIPHAMQLYEATEGRKPRSHDEFMDKIVKFNQINLPELPEGQVYQYHPDDGQLWVEPVKK